MNPALRHATLAIAAYSLLTTPALAKDRDVTFDQLPTAVQATVQRETRGGTITDIELEDEQGVVTYEIEYFTDVTKYELDIAADGTLLRRKLD